MRLLAFVVFAAAFAALASAVTPQQCRAQYDQCFIDCCEADGGYIETESDGYFECAGYRSSGSDFDDACSDPCYDDWQNCLAYASYATGGSGGGCCGAFILLGIGAVLCARLRSG